MESTSLWSEAPTGLPSDKRLAPDHVCQQAQVAGHPSLSTAGGLQGGEGSS